MNRTLEPEVKTMSVGSKIKLDLFIYHVLSLTKGDRTASQPIV